MTVSKSLPYGLCLGLTLFAGAALAEIKVIEPWARLQPPSSPMSAAFLVLENTGAEPDALIGASCDCAQSVELHVMAETDGKMTMRQVQRFDLPAGGRFELKSGGPHLMLIGLTAPLDPAKPVHLKLLFEHAPEQTLEAPVRDPRAPAGL